MQLFGIFPSYSFSQPPCSRFEQWWQILHLRRTKITRRKYDRWWYVIIKIIIIFIILKGFLPNFHYPKFSVLLLLRIFYSKSGNYKKNQWQQCDCDKRLRVGRLRSINLAVSEIEYFVCIFLVEFLLNYSMASHDGNEVTVQENNLDRSIKKNPWPYVFHSISNIQISYNLWMLQYTYIYRSIPWQ